MIPIHFRSRLKKGGNMTETEIEAFKEGYYFLYSEEETEPCLVRVYTSTDFGYKGIGFNVHDGAGFMPFWDLKEGSKLIPAIMTPDLPYVDKNTSTLSFGKCILLVDSKTGLVVFNDVSVKLETDFSYEMRHGEQNTILGREKLICHDTVVRGSFNGKSSEGTKIDYYPNKENKEMQSVKSDKQWQKESDARTLAEAERIKSDKTRHTGAKQAARTMAKEHEQETKHLSKIAGSAKQTTKSAPKKK